MTDVAQVQIVNSALFALGQEPVTDLSEASLQASGAATKLMRAIEQARDSVLRRHLWLSAKGWATLPPAVLAEPANWRYPVAFLAPPDCLRVWEIAGEPYDARLPGGWGPRWEVNTIEPSAGAAQTVIRASAADIDSLDITYVRRAAWGALDAHLRDAVAYDLAARTAWNITSDRALAKELAAQAEQRAQLAIGSDGDQDGGQPAAAPSIPAAIRNCSR